jgi:hypothetical protein
MKYPDDMDAECVELSDALNTIKGVQSVSSCCGHGKRPFRVWFRCGDFRSLARIAYAADPCHSGADFHVEVRAGCDCQAFMFMIEGPIGDYEGAKRVAQVLKQENEVV